MNETTYTLQVKAVGDHLEVTILPLGITIQTGPGETSNDAALDVAHAAIDTWMLEQRSHETVVAS